MSNKGLRLSCWPSRAEINSNLIKRMKVDRISALPDELLVHIVAFLPLDEAQSTSVLSKRWRCIWKSMLEYTMTLDFDAEKYLSNFASREELAIPYYVDWVDTVLRQYRSPKLRQFRVSYDLDGTFSSSIDEWVRFAMTKGVEILELDLLEFGISRRWDYPPYEFPYRVLGIMKESAWKNIYSDVSSLGPCPCIGFKTLKVLTLKCVDVNGQFLEYMLSNCAVLERLSITDSLNLGSLRVVGPSIALKYLEVRWCKLESIEICDANLVSFVYYGKQIDLTIRNVPLLVEVSICESCNDDYLQVAFSQLSDCHSQLKTLKLVDIILPYKRNPVFPMFTNVKHLELRFEAGDDCILHHLSSFIRASPCLHKLILELYPLSKTKRKLKPAKCFHEWLRVVEIFGYQDSDSDLELLKFLRETAVNLEEIVTYIAHPADRHYCFPKHRLKPDLEYVATREQSDLESRNIHSIRRLNGVI